MSDDPIPAATLIVVREQNRQAPEILMVERAQEMKFAGGALVFPGGRIDESDREFARSLQLDHFGPALVAAVRETIEETAVPAGLQPVPDPEVVARFQLALTKGADFEELLADHGITLAPDNLVAFSRWLPKFHAVRRFDTLFFLAAAPPGEWEPNAIAQENSQAFWISAADALEQDRRGTAQLIFPTRRNLERLAQHESLSAMIADARAYPVEPITPWVEDHGGERFVTIPAGIGYPVTRERLEGLWRG
jgi:8-oxo-dGTP pyrophosphatase MutT (NUDIX family)